MRIRSFLRILCQKSSRAFGGQQKRPSFCTQENRSEKTSRPALKYGVIVVEELKSIKYSVFKTLLASLQVAETEDEDTVAPEKQSEKHKENKLARDLLNALLFKAGQSKNEVVQILGKEMGTALAAMLKGPLGQVVENRALRITVELVPKDDQNDSQASSSSNKRSSSSKATSSAKSSRKRSQSRTKKN